MASARLTPFRGTIMLCPSLHAFIILTWLWKVGRMIYRKRNRKEIRTTLAPSIRSICSHVLCGVSYAYGRRKSFAMSFIILYSWLAITSNERFTIMKLQCQAKQARYSIGYPAGASTLISWTHFSSILRRSYKVSAPYSVAACPCPTRSQLWLRFCLKPAINALWLLTSIFMRGSKEMALRVLRKSLWRAFIYSFMVIYNFCK